MDGVKKIMVCGEEWEVITMKKLFIRSENWPALRHRFQVNEDSRQIIVEKKNRLQNIASALEDVIMTRTGAVPLVD